MPRRIKQRCYHSDEEPPSSGESECDLGWRDCCICGYRSDSDWNIDWCQDCKKVKVEINEDENIHDQFHRAIEKHDCRTIRQLLEDGVIPCTTYKSTSCFTLAHKTKYILKRFLDIEPSGINCQDSRGFTMLMLTSDHEDAVFKFLCKYKPDINIMNNDGDNIFFYLLKAQRHNFHAWQLEKLLELGLDVNSVSSQGETAMVVAIREGVEHYTIEKLLKAGATPPPPFNDDESIVTHPIQNNRLNFRDKIDFLGRLMKLGIVVNAKDIDGRNVMYYIIQEQYKLLMNMHDEINILWINLLANLLNRLLEKNCEVQGLCLTFERKNMCKAYSYVEKLDIIGTFARYVQRTEFLEQLVNRGLYDWKEIITMHRELFPGTGDPMSPLTAYLSRLFTHSFRKPNFWRIFRTCKYFISIGVDAAHRCLDRNFQVEADIFVDIVYDSQVSELVEELTYPDALFFLAQCSAINGSNCDMGEESVVPFEELLRLFVSFWPYPPLFLLFLRAGLEVWDPNAVLLDTLNYYPHRASEDLAVMTRLLLKIGGAVPLGTRYYKVLKSILENITKQTGGVWPQMLDSFLGLDGGIPTLRSLSRAAFRATVKKTCPTGLDFSEYRVQCQGEMIPIPPEVVNHLEFRPNPTKAS